MGLRPEGSLYNEVTCQERGWMSVKWGPMSHVGRPWIVGSHILKGSRCARGGFPVWWCPMSHGLWSHRTPTLSPWPDWQTDRTESIAFMQLIWLVVDIGVYVCVLNDTIFNDTMGLTKQGLERQYFKIIVLFADWFWFRILYITSELLPKAESTKHMQ